MDESSVRKEFLWPLARDLRRPLAKLDLYKADPLLEQFEDLIGAGFGWRPVKGSTKRVESLAKRTTWLSEQRAHKTDLEEKGLMTRNVTLNTGSFPTTPNGRRVITTSHSVLFLLDRTQDVLRSLRLAFGNKAERTCEVLMPKELPVLVFVSNSVESGGRAFSGDPFTGEVASYSRTFCYDITGTKVRWFLCYYPHQLYSQFFLNNGAKPSNKGVKILQSHADVIITAGGIVIEPKSWRLE